MESLPLFLTAGVQQNTRKRNKNDANTTIVVGGSAIDTQNFIKHVVEKKRVKPRRATISSADARARNRKTKDR